MKEQTTINQRVRYVMDALDYDEARFARRIGVSKGAVTNVVSNNEDPSYAMLKNITTVLPVSKEWLMLGTGKPWTSDSWRSYKESDPHAVDKELNNRFREIRESENLSQTLFAAELGVTRDVVCNIENLRSSPSINVLKLLHKNFKINPYWVMYGDKPMKLK